MHQSNPNQRWMPVPHSEWSHLYEISNFGEVRRTGSDVNRKLFRANGKHKKDPYLRVTLSKNGRYGTGGTRQNFQVHRLVARAFLGEPPKGRPQVNHKDLDKLNNYIDNLEWSSAKDNVQHAIRYYGTWGKKRRG